MAKRDLGEILSSFELIDRVSVEDANRTLGLKSPLSTDHDFYTLIETSGSNLAHDEEKLTAFLEKVMERGYADDGTYTSEPSKVRVRIIGGS